MAELPPSRSARAAEADALRRATNADFTPNANRKAVMEFNGFATTETCELSCVFCHFNGPNAIKKARTLDQDLVKKGLEQVPAGRKVHFAATGDFFQDPHALDHLRNSIELGHPVNVLSHGQSMPPDRLEEMLAMGVREFRFSVDHIEPRQYAKIRRGGDLDRVLSTIAYLRTRKADLPDISIEVNCILIGDARERMEEFAEFWSTRVDAVYFHAEYYDVLRFRNLFFVPEKRNDCHIQLYVLPSGQIAPCCAMMVQAHEEKVSWLPNIADTPLQVAYEQLCDMYEDPNSELGKVCAKCDWWVMWSEHRDGCTPYLKSVRFDKPEQVVEAVSLSPTSTGVVDRIRQWFTSLIRA